MIRIIFTILMLHCVAAIAQRDQSAPVTIDQRALYLAGSDMLKFHRQSSQGSMLMLSGATLATVGVLGARSGGETISYSIMSTIGCIAGAITHHSASKHIGRAGTVLISASGVTIKKKPRISK